MVVAGLAGCTAALVPAAADACGGLIGENGTIELVRTTTLAAYSGGVERYVTAFEFTGEGESVGSIVPLPDVPTSVERGGDWTLQRLALEVAPPAAREGDDDAEATVAASAEVEIVLQTQIDALDITVLKGGGDEVGQWALENGFLLTPDAPEVLDFYAHRSPVFMAAKFDAQRALALGQGAGDSTPIMATIPTDDPWVPVRILGLGLDERPRRRGRRLPLDRPAARAARRRPGPDARAQRGGVERAAHRPAVGRRDGVGAGLDVAVLPPARRRGRRPRLRPRRLPGAGGRAVDHGRRGRPGLGRAGPPGAGRARRGGRSPSAASPAPPPSCW